jgi:hypothetical protein
LNLATKPKHSRLIKGPKSRTTKTQLNVSNKVAEFSSISVAHSPRDHFDIQNEIIRGNVCNSFEEANHVISELDELVPRVHKNREMKNTSVMLSKNNQGTRNSMTNNYPLQFNSSVSGVSRMNPLSSGLNDQKGSRVLIKDYSQVPTPPKVCQSSQFQTAEKNK